MSRLSFVLGLKKKERNSFINNLIAKNSPGFAEYWLLKEMDDSGLLGAFPWSLTKEGHDYWDEIDNKIKKVNYEI